MNKNNKTIPMNIFNIDNISVGINSYGELNIVSFADIHKIIIGNYVSIAQNVQFILDAEHYTQNISTYPFKVKLLETEKEEAFGKGDIIVEDDVWIGYGATIMSGVHIGQGAVVAAGAVVSKDVPPYAIVGGVPAKIIKYRFSEDVIKEMLTLDYSKLTKEMVEEHIEELYNNIVNVQVEEIKTIYKWFPRKT